MAKEFFSPSPDGASPRHNEKSDMWAFGMVIYVCQNLDNYISRRHSSHFQEMLSWKVPYFNLKDIFVMPAVMRGELPEKPEEPETSMVFNKLWNFSLLCWADRRPSASEMVDLLDCIGKQPLRNKKKCLENACSSFSPDDDDIQSAAQITEPQTSPDDDDIQPAAQTTEPQTYRPLKNRNPCVHCKHVKRRVRMRYTPYLNARF